MSRVIYSILWAHTETGVSHSQHRKKSGEVWGGGNAAEWTGRADTGKQEVPGIKRSMHGYIRTCSWFKGENLWALGSQQTGLQFLRPHCPHCSWSHRIHSNFEKLLDALQTLNWKQNDAQTRLTSSGTVLLFSPPPPLPPTPTPTSPSRGSLCFRGTRSKHWNGNRIIKADIYWVQYSRLIIFLLNMFFLSKPDLSPITFSGHYTLRISFPFQIRSKKSSIGREELALYDGNPIAC